MKKRKVTVYICLILLVFTALIGVIYAAGLHSDADCGKSEAFCPSCDNEMTLCCSTQKCTDEELYINAYYCENCGFFERGSQTDCHNEANCSLPKLNELIKSEKKDSCGNSSALAAADICGVCGSFGCDILH